MATIKETKKKLTKEQKKARDELILRDRPKDMIIKLKDGSEAIISKDKVKEILNEEKEKSKEEKKEDFLIYETNKAGEITKIKVNASAVAEFLLNKYHFKTIFETKSEKIYLFKDGIYCKDGRETIQTQVEEILKEHCTNHYVKEIEEKIKRLTAIDREEFENVPEELVCLENGILNLKTGKFEEHNPNYYFKVKLPIEYNPEADCPKIKKFLEETLYPDDVKIMQEWFGFSLYRRYFIKKAMILFGPTDTGKTVLLNLLTTWLGEKNISTLSLQRIGHGDKFRLVALENKYANIFDDLTSEDMKEDGGFKIATGGGWLAAEHKFGDQFQFQTYAKLIFAGNKIPSIKDVDDEEAYYNRWIPIPFDNPIPKNKQDKFYINKLTTKEEMSGLLNWALEGLRRIFKNNGFSYKKGWEETKRTMERHSNSIAAFCQDVLIEKEGNKISKEAMYKIYSLYVKEAGKNRAFARLSKSQLGRNLPKYAKYILAKHSKERYWENVDIKKNCSESIQKCLKISSNPLVNDTLDTFSKNIYMELKDSKKSKKDNVLQLYNIIPEKASKVSEDKKTPNPKKESKVSEEIDFSFLDKEFEDG